MLSLEDGGLGTERQAKLRGPTPLTGRAGVAPYAIS